MLSWQVQQSSACRSGPIWGNEMRLNEVTYNDAKPIEGYGPGFFRIGGEVFHSAVLTSGQGTFEWSGYDDAATLLALAGDIDVLFVGTRRGRRAHPDRPARSARRSGPRGRGNGIAGGRAHL